MEWFGIVVGAGDGVSDGFWEGLEAGQALDFGGMCFGVGFWAEARIFVDGLGRTERYNPRYLPIQFLCCVFLWVILPCLNIGRCSMFVSIKVRDPIWGLGSNGEISNELPESLDVP